MQEMPSLHERRSDGSKEDSWVVVRQRKDLVTGRLYGVEQSDVVSRQIVSHCTFMGQEELC